MSSDRPIGPIRIGCEGCGVSGERVVSLAIQLEVMQTRWEGAPMTCWIAVGSALVSIGAISLVLRWGMTGRAGTPPFESAVLVLGIATPLASVLLTWHLWRRGRRGGALVSATPATAMLLGTIVAVAWAPPSLTALLWLDLYVLLAFAVVLSRFGPGLLRSSAVPGVRAESATDRSAA